MNKFIEGISKLFDWSTKPEDYDFLQIDDQQAVYNDWKVVGNDLESAAKGSQLALKARVRQKA